MALAGILTYAAATLMTFGLVTGPASNTAAAATGPDLSSGAISGPLWAKPGERVHFETCVENFGDQPSGDFNIAWYVSGERLGYGRHLSVPAHTRVCKYQGGADGNSFFDWTVPNDSGGSRIIKWEVDTDRQVPDKLRRNNSIERTIKITG